MPWKAEVIDGEGSKTFETREKAEAYALKLQFSWTSLLLFRTIEIVHDPDLFDRIIID